MDQSQVEGRATAQANSCEAVLQGGDVALGDLYIGMQPADPARRLVGKQLRKVRFGPLNLRTLDCLAASERAGHHVDIGQVCHGALQPPQRCMCLCETCVVQAAMRDLAWRRRSDQRNNVRMPQGGNQVRLSVGRDVVPAHGLLR